MAKIKANKKINKMTIAVIALSVALIAAIGAVFGVYAAMQQNVSTSFSVTYSIGNNVAVAVGAKTVQQNSTEDPVWFTTSNKTVSTNENNLYVLSAPAGDYNLGLQGGNLTASYDSWRWICFYVENLSNTNTIQATFKDGAVTNPDSYGMYFLYIGGIIPGTEKMADGYADAELNSFELNSNNEYSFTIPPQTIYAIQIGISAYEVNKTCTYISDTNGAISFVFENYTGSSN